MRNKFRTTLSNHSTYTFLNMNQLRLFSLGFFVLLIDCIIKCVFLAKIDVRANIIVVGIYMMLSLIVVVCLLVFNLIFFRFNLEVVTKFNKYTLIAYILLTTIADSKVSSNQFFREHWFLALWSMIPVTISFLLFRYSESDEEV